MCLGRHTARRTSPGCMLLDYAGSSISSIPDDSCAFFPNAAYWDAQPTTYSPYSGGTYLVFGATVGNIHVASAVVPKMGCAHIPIFRHKFDFLPRIGYNFHTMPPWWNWYTRQVEGLCPSGHLRSNRSGGTCGANRARFALFCYSGFTQYIRGRLAHARPNTNSLPIGAPA